MSLCHCKVCGNQLKTVGGTCECRSKADTGKSNSEEVRLTDEDIKDIRSLQCSPIHGANMLNVIQGLKIKWLNDKSAKIEALKSQIQSIKDRLKIENIIDLLIENDYWRDVPDSYDRTMFYKQAEAIHNKLEG